MNRKQWPVLLSHNISRNISRKCGRYIFYYKKDEKESAEA
jgi:hypothetical protein